MSIDHTKFSVNGKPAKASKNESLSKQWWKLATGDERASSVTQVIQTIFNQDTQRLSQYLMSMRLYGNMNPAGLSGFATSVVPQNVTGIRDRLTYNVIQSAGDTVAAKIAKNKPKPMFLTSGGSYKMQRKAKKLDKFVEGVFYENEAFILGPQIFIDSYVLGDGLVQVFAEDRRVKYDRTLACELFVPREESVYGKPRQLHRVKIYDREVLMDMFPDHADYLKTASPYNLTGTSNGQSVSDVLTVGESWHLQSGKESTDGLHTITLLGGKELMNKEWAKPYFPFAKLPWTRRQVGFWSQGGAEQIQSIQLEINKILYTIQRSYQLAGSFKIWMKIGSKIIKEHLNNDIGTIIESDEAPQYMVPPIVQPEVYATLKERKSDAYEQVGASQLSASSVKPAGVDSGKAMRTLNNIETERFTINGLNYENFFLQLGRLTVDCAREIADSGKEDLSVKSPNSKFIDTINWKDCSLEDEDMIMQMFPVSSLSNDPSERFQDIQEWVQAGWISPRTAKRLMSFPDVEAAQDLDNAKEDYLHMILEKIVDDGEFTPPEPFDDLTLAKSLFLDYYAWAKINGVEEDKLEILRNFNDQIDLLVQKSMPPQPMAPGGPAPQANPMAPPQSDLIQNVPAA